MKVEKYGIETIPKKERTKNWFDLFVISAGLNIALSTILVGGLLVPKLSWSDIIIALVLGNLILGILISLVGFIGVDYGISSSVASRFSLGYPKGTTIPSLFILIALIGWYAVNAEIGGIAVDESILSILGYSNPVLMIIVVGISNAFIAILGIESIKWLSRFSVPLLMILTMWIFYKILKLHDISSLIHYTPTNEIRVTTAIDWIIGGLVVGIFLASDVTRYVRSRKDSLIGYLLGVVPISVFLMLLGAVSTLSTGDWNPIYGVSELGLGFPAVFIIFFATWTTNDCNLYSGGLALTNIFSRLKRWQNTLIVSVFGTTLAAFRITEHLPQFLEFLNYAFSPLIGILLADYFVVKKRQLILSEIYNEKSIYHYFHGLNLIALFVIVIGFVVGFFLPPYLIASLVTIIFSGIMYSLLMKLVLNKRIDN